MNYGGSNGKLTLYLADKHSSDQVSLSLEPEEVKKLEEIIKNVS